MMVLIFFNLIVPTGWSVGLIRVEDVVVGALVGVVVSLLLWPRGRHRVGGGGGRVGPRRRSPTYLEAAVLRVTRGASEHTADRLATLSHDAIAASRVADDAVRQYLSESGGSTDFRGPRWCGPPTARSGVRAAADLIMDIPTPPPLGTYPRVREVLESHADAIGDRLAGDSAPAGTGRRSATSSCSRCGPKRVQDGETRRVGRAAAGDGGGRDRRTRTAVSASGAGRRRPPVSQRTRCGISAFGGMVPNLPAL